MTSTNLVVCWSIIIKWVEQISWINSSILLDPVEKPRNGLKKVAIHLKMLSCLSACKLFTKHTGKKIPFLSFMHDLIASLLTCIPKLNRQVIREETASSHWTPFSSHKSHSGRRRKKKNEEMSCLCQRNIDSKWESYRSQQRSVGELQKSTPFLSWSICRPRLFYSLPY